jgi:hypothetical protein
MGKVHTRLKDSPVRWGAIGLQITGILTAAAALLLAWKYVRPAEVAAFWPPIQTAGQAIGEVVTMSAIGRPVSWVVALLTLLGLMTVVNQRRQLWLISVYLVVGALYIVVSAMPFGDLRTFITGVWYNDPPRLAALLPVAVVPLAVVGCKHIFDSAMERVIPRLLNLLRHWPALLDRRQSTQGAVGSVFAAALLIGLVAGTQQANVRVAADAAAPGYRITNASALLSSDELALIGRLKQNVPADATLIGNPWNGSALAYALADRKTIQLHILSAVPDGAEKLYEKLREAKADPGICPAVRGLGIKYVLDFGHQEVHGGDHGFRGLDGLDSTGVATLVDEQGAAKLYKITACG